MTSPTRRRVDPGRVYDVYEQERRYKPYGALSRAAKQVGLSHTRVAQIVAQEGARRVSFAAVTPTTMIMRPAMGWDYVEPRVLLETVQVAKVATSLPVAVPEEKERQRERDIIRRRANISYAVFAASVVVLLMELYAAPWWPFVLWVRLAWCAVVLALGHGAAAMGRRVRDDT